MTDPAVGAALAQLGSRITTTTAGSHFGTGLMMRLLGLELCFHRIGCTLRNRIPEREPRFGTVVASGSFRHRAGFHARDRTARTGTGRLSSDTSFAAEDADKLPRPPGRGQQSPLQG